MRIPLIGQVAAGRPIKCLHQKSYRQISPIPGAKRTDKFVGMQVCGESMRGAGILNGDYVICCTTRQAREGDIVIAETPFGPVVKYLHQEGERVLLRSANTDFNDLAWLPEDVRVFGIVKRVERDL